MPTDPLDDRIRSMMSDAMSSAPAAPSLSLRAPVRATPPRRGLLWAGIGIAASITAVGALVWTSGDDDHTIVSASTSTPVTEPSLPWPTGVAAVVASSRGIERVSSENGQAVVTRVLDGVGVARAIQLEDGGIVFQEMGGDIRYMAPDGTVSDTALVTDDGNGSTVLEDADSPNGELRLVYRVPTTDPAAAGDLGVWLQPLEPRYELLPGGFGVGYQRFTIVDEFSVAAATIDDTGQRGSYKSTYRNGVAETAVDSYDDPVALAGDGAGSVGWVTADGGFTTTGVRDGSQPELTVGLDVTELDWRGQWLMVTQQGGLAATLVDLVTEARYQVPVSGGVVTLSRYAVPSTQPVPTTVPTTVLEPTPSTALPESLPSVVTAGPNGVWEYGPDGEVQWTAEPMAFAVKAPDGSMLMQRQSGGYPGAGWTQADTLPLRQASPGAPIEDLFDELFPAADVVAGWYTLHDAAMVNGQPLVILDRQSDLVNIESPAGALLVLDLDAASLVEIDQIGGWESASSRMHLATNGLIVGETYSEAVRSFYSVRVDGTPALSAANLGLEPNYYDCNDCPRLYTISRDGSTIAWLDGTTLIRFSLGDLEMPPVELGDLTGGPLEATDLSISADVAVYDRNFSGAPSTPVIVYLDSAGRRAEELAPAARTALP
ncbi:MAG: hypothetical protein HY828_00735 [Actinobacteria bacterium]|nr:hypothetical protein [Actinomycetota bacterium]